MSKKYYWIIDGKYYEVSKETYQKFKREYDHAKMLDEYEKKVIVLSLDAVTSGELCPPSKNGHKKASKNEMNRSISLIYENRPHLFHGLLDNEPLPA